MPGAQGLSHRPAVQVTDTLFPPTVCEAHTKFVLALSGKKETYPTVYTFLVDIAVCLSVCGSSHAGDASLTLGFSVDGLNPVLPGLPVTASQFPGIPETPLPSCTQCSWL